MVDPNKVSIIDGDGITTPDILGVKVRDLNVLYNHVRSVLDPQATALDDTAAPRADQTLVAGDGDAERGGGVV